MTSYILNFSCVYFTTDLTQSSCCGFVMSVSQTLRTVIYCIHLVYIYYHVSISCIHHYVIKFVNDLRQVWESSTYKTACHDKKNEILLKVALSTITLTPMYPSFHNTLWLILSGYCKTNKVHSALILLYLQMYVLDNTKTANETSNCMLFVFSYILSRM